MKDAFNTIKEGISNFQGISFGTSSSPSQSATPKTTRTSAPVASTPKNEVLKSPAPAASGVSIDTYIKSGPRNNEVIDKTNKVTFEFKSILSPENTGGEVSFDTKMEGLETTWQETYSTQRTIELPGGQKEYTFWVRAKIKEKNIIDQTPAKITFKLNLSPYFNKIKISEVRPPGFLYYSLITLNTYLQSNETIDITGWQIEGKRNTAQIPQGIETYNPLNQTASYQDIIIKQGDTIYISSEANPLGGNNWNFRENKCMGYLKSSHNFPIAISETCPRISSDKLPSYLEECCKQYANTLGACKQPTYQGMESYGILKDSNCFNYLTYNLSYAGCYANYFQDKDFLQNKMHIYLNRTDREIMDVQMDTISLYDKNGLLVNKYDYGTAPCCQ